MNSKLHWKSIYRTPTEPSSVQYMMIKESDYEWERDGDPVADVISECAEIGCEPADDIREVLAGRHYDIELVRMGEESPFSRDAHYAERGVDDTELRAGWSHFEKSLKTQARYFSHTAEETLTSIFEGITEHNTRDGRPIVVEAGPGTALSSLYRARVFQSDTKLAEALKAPDKGLGPPPALLAPAGRMNARGISVFYGATDRIIALAEVRPPVASRVL